MRSETMTQVAFFLLRIAAGIMFFQTGAMKTFGWFGGMPPDGGTAELLTQIGIGGMLEVVGGAMIVLGLFTRPAAFILSGEMAVAYFQFHQPVGYWPVQNQGTAAALYCFLWFFIAFYGAGRWSLDALIGGKREAAPANRP